MILLPVFLIVVFSLTQIANATEVKGLYRSQTIVTGTDEPETTANSGRPSRMSL